jgi:hypothetical protein
VRDCFREFQKSPQQRTLLQHLWRRRGIVVDLRQQDVGETRISHRLAA